jgi:hypothetical protein
LYIVVLKDFIAINIEDGVILARKPGGKNTLGKPRLRWEDNIKIDI